MIPERMTTIAVRGDGSSPDSLVAEEAETPRPAAGEILIRVGAAGVNRPDILQRRGLYPPPPGAPATLGLEAAGEVVAVGDGATRWREGDRVTALLGGGGYAEYAKVDARHALPISGALAFEEAAALPETVFTVWANVFEAGALKPGETLLVHGATSGIGVTAIQMGKAAGAKVIATGRGPEKAKAAHDLGADAAVDSAADEWVGFVEAIGGRTRPASTQGQTVCSTTSASRAFSSDGRLRRVEPVRLSRFIMIGRRSSSTRCPARKAICTRRPPGLSTRRFRCT